MSSVVTPAVLARGLALLERALGYTLGSLLLVTPDRMTNATPCAGWDLRALLLHMNDSLQTLHEAVAVGRLDLETADPRTAFGDPALDPVASLRNRGCAMVGAWANAASPPDIAIADRTLSPGIVAAAGAVEVAVHGWDVSRACGERLPVPPALAQELYDLCQVLVREGDRAGRFGARVELSSGDRGSDGPSDRLVAFLGRQP